jgi:hypothetical protein
MLLDYRLERATSKSMKGSASHFRFGITCIHAIRIGVATAVVSLVMIAPVFAAASSSTYRFPLPGGGAILYSKPSNPRAPLSDRSWERAVFAFPDGTMFGLLPRIGQLNTGGTEIEPPKSADISPSGQYVVIALAETGTVWQGQGKPETVLSREYCPVVEIRTGCITSDQTGEICGQGWTAGQPAQWGTDAQTSTMLKRDRPSASNLLGYIEAGNPADGVLRNDAGADNVLRCDPLSSSNRASYRKIAAALRAKNATGDALLIEAALSKGLDDSLATRESKDAERRSAIVSVAKATLFTVPGEASRAYLVRNDAVTVLNQSSDGWAYVDYVSPFGKHLLRWIKADQISIKP